MKTNNNTSLPKGSCNGKLEIAFAVESQDNGVVNPDKVLTLEIYLIMFIVTLFSATNDSQGPFAYNLLVFIILLVTLLFANSCRGTLKPGEGSGRQLAQDP